jgi:transcriptional regulator with XRE-family HTH domain
MRKPIDGKRVKSLRERLRLSQKDTAEKAKISVDSLSRIERGRQTGKARNTFENLSRVLGVTVDVLTGDAPLPPVASMPEASGDHYQINVRVDGAIRNAFSLATLRYRIPAKQIIELAPLLFVIAAEQSLQRRSARVAEFESAVDKVRNLGEASHSYFLLAQAIQIGSPSNVRAERKSIESRDILAERIDEFLDWNSIVHDEEIMPYKDARDNPFVQSLRESVDGLNVAWINQIWRDEAEYEVCPDEIDNLAGGDVEIAAMISGGSILIRDIPADMLRDESGERRKEWLQAKAAEVRTAREESWRSQEELLGP